MSPELIPFVILTITTTAAALGLYLFALFLKRRRPANLILGVHILLGMAGLEQVAVLIRGAGPSGAAAAGQFGTAAAALFALSLFSGFVAPIVAQRSKQGGIALLYSHVGLGLAGFASLLIWFGSFAM
ncbi:hypothetical protein Rvan_3326 [Rhodomicrobium vannielii ATCC 17100]|uniref:Uncharacterized protein n=1 Tax=Rhodomicrobium vannielii (strain ATCC 17100 / DSM 162 / LMG 4299 / NCIMB 10020 / ATH 3.1.1) TaxID=648757 RepID=E3I2R6_RHOVT|nr:hypothetical protein [Rhodomicrobium vannielii]ADP72511.1 hypothetical protein Rvan_3326 [Rhodomicrobium vannielii ATCC 17100]